MEDSVRLREGKPCIVAYVIWSCALSLALQYCNLLLSRPLLKLKLTVHAPRGWRGLYQHQRGDGSWGAVPGLAVRVASPGKYAGSTQYLDSINNLRVIVNSDTGRVITVIPGVK